MRISRDEMLMSMAFISSLRGTCRRLRVGAIIARESRPISLGYNGNAPGEPHCGDQCDLSHPCTTTIHAEENSLLWAARYGIDVSGATLYTTHSPCWACAEKILNAGISRVVYSLDYRCHDPIVYLRGRGVEVCQCSIDPATSVNFVRTLHTPVSRE